MNAVRGVLSKLSGGTEVLAPDPAWRWRGRWSGVLGTGRAEARLTGKLADGGFA